MATPSTVPELDAGAVAARDLFDELLAASPAPADAGAAPTETADGVVAPADLAGVEDRDAMTAWLRALMALAASETNDGKEDGDALLAAA